MDMQLINNELLSELHQQAGANERKRQNFDLRNTPDDTSQRMLNVLEVGTKVPIHRHLKSSETVVCLEGCLDEVFFVEMPNMDAGGSIHDGETAVTEDSFAEIARVRLCPREKCYGIQIPKGAWHKVVVLEPSTILEMKDGAYIPTLQ